MKSHCESFPCRNGGTYQPLYETDDYYCKCGKNFTGNHCERQRAIFVPDPVAFYPLNAKYVTREFNNRQPQGTPVGVFLSPGPDGKPGGSYQFTGNVDSYIEFPNNGGLDVKYSMTLVFWVFPESLDGPLVLFSYFGTQMWFVFQGQLYIRLVRVGIDNVVPLMSSSVPLSQWYFVASSYDYNSGIGRLYVNGEKAVELNVGAGIEHATQYDIRMGAVPSDPRFFRGRIHGLQVYNVSLTKQ